MGVSLRVVDWLRSAGHEVTHLRDEGLQLLPNGDIFQKAHTEGRIVLTFDWTSAKSWLVPADKLSAWSYFGFTTPEEHVIKRLETVLKQSSAALLSGAIIVVEESRHRVRSLPIGS